MYSRNASKRRDKRSVVEQGEKREEYCPLNIPSAPPNYRGMLYDIEKKDLLAEGIERLAANDPSYDRFECPKNTQKKAQNRPREQGIQKIIDDLKSSAYLPEDLLICALIILMLNAGSEDDMLLILVLMMLF